MTKVDWTRDKVRTARLRALADDGLSQGQVAAAMGLTRSQIAGGATRHGVTFKSAMRKGAALRASLAWNTGHRRAPTPIKYDEPEGGVTLMNARSHHCRWPLGMPGHDDFRFCGKRGYPWCPAHAAIGYNTEAPRMTDRDLVRMARKWA